MKKLILSTCVLVFTFNAFALKSEEYFENSDQWNYLIAKTQNENYTMEASFYKTDRSTYRLNRLTGLQLVNSEVVFKYKDEISEKDISQICKSEWKDFKIPNEITLVIHRNSFSKLSNFSIQDIKQLFSSKSLENPILSSQISKFRIVDKNNLTALGKYSDLQNLKEHLSSFNTGYAKMALSYVNQQINSSNNDLFSSEDMSFDLTPYWGLACDLATDTTIYPIFDFSFVAERAMLPKSAWLSLDQYSEISNQFLETPVKIKTIEDLDIKKNIVSLALNLGASLEKTQLPDKAIKKENRLNRLYKNLENIFLASQTQNSSAEGMVTKIEKSYPLIFEVQYPENMQIRTNSSARVQNPKLKITQKYRGNYGN